MPCLRRIGWATVLLAALALPAGASAETISIVTADKNLLTIDSAAPSTVLATVAISGTGIDTLDGIDVRPATGQLYLLGNSGTTVHLYVLDPDTGVATQLGAGITAGNAGVSWGFDVNPTADRIRVVNSAGENLRLDPDTGNLAATDTPLNQIVGTPRVVASAYSNSFAGAISTTLYAIDSTTDTLEIQSPPNDGFLTAVMGTLGVDTGDSVGFDISGTSGVAYAALTVTGVAGLYTVNLATGAATLTGAIGGLGTVIAGLAVRDTGPVGFGVPATTVFNESAGTIQLPVVRAAPTASALRVGYTVSAGTAGADDVVLGSGTVVMVRDQTVQTIPVQLIDDALPEGAETFTVTLNVPGVPRGTVSIALQIGADNDAVPVVTPPDTTPPFAFLFKTRRTMARTLVVQFAGSESGTAVVELRLGAALAKTLKVPVRLAKFSQTVFAGAAQTATFSLSAQTLKRLRRRRTITASVRLTLTDAAGNQRVAQVPLTLVR